MKLNEHEKAAWTHYLKTQEVIATTYRRGAVVEGWPPMFRENPDKPRNWTRGIIQNQSARSLIRASHAIANSPVDWELMLTLTFRSSHPYPKHCLRRMLKTCFGSNLNNVPVCWVQEFQRRGVIHYHVLTTMDALLPGWPSDSREWVTKGRGKKRREVLQGPMGCFLAAVWTENINDSSNETYSFCMGGMVEKLRNPESSGIYLGSYVGKIAQKQLPEGCAPQGRWWWMSPCCEPIPGDRIRLTEWHHRKPHRLVHDKTKLVGEKLPGGHPEKLIVLPYATMALPS